MPVPGKSGTAPNGAPPPGLRRTRRRGSPRGPRWPRRGTLHPPDPADASPAQGVRHGRGSPCRAPDGPPRTSRGRADGPCLPLAEQHGVWSEDRAGGEHEANGRTTVRSESVVRAPTTWRMRRQHRCPMTVATPSTAVPNPVFPGRWVSGASLVVGLLLLLTGVLLRLRFDFFFPAQPSAYGHHPNLMTASYSFVSAGWVLLWPGVMLLAGLDATRPPGGTVPVSPPCCAPWAAIALARPRAPGGRTRAAGHRSSTVRSTGGATWPSGASTGSAVARHRHPLRQDRRVLPGGRHPGRAADAGVTL